jgi:hypothetical protein
MVNLRDQIERLLRDTPKINSNQIPSMWSMIWSSIHDKEIIDYCKLVTVQQTWKGLKEDLISKCYDVAKKIYNNEDHLKPIERLKNELTSRINQVYAKDQYCREALLSIFNEENPFF